MSEINSLMSWDGTGKIYSEEAVQTLQAEIERLREAQRWIPVSERLPETRGFYICSNVDRETKKVFVEERFFIGGIWDVYFSDVTHWMPLPQPPQEAEG